MSPIRVLITSVHQELEPKLPELVDLANRVRQEQGCLEFEFFRDPEFPENLAQVELWETIADFDRRWKLHGQLSISDELRSLQSPYHNGLPAFPRRHGQSGVEFYHQTYFQISGGIIAPLDQDLPSKSIRWPTMSGVRILMRANSDPAIDAEFKDYSMETRAQAGCLEFAFYRSLEFPENNLHLELWAAPPEAYDLHFLYRGLQRLWGLGVKRPVPQRVEGRYGGVGMEFYQHQFFALTGDVWEPEEANRRMVTIQWP